MLLGVFNNLTGHGGVQRLARQMALVMHRVAREHGMPFELLALNDPEPRGTVAQQGEQIAYLGFGRRTGAFTMEALRLAPLAHAAYFNHPFISPVGALMRLRSPRLRYGVHAHGLEAWTPMRLDRQFGLRRAHVVTTTSACTGRMIRECQRLQPPRLRTLHPPFEPVSESEANEAVFEPFFLTVSRLQPYARTKGVDIAIEAFAACLADLPPEFKLMIVGAGDDLPHLQKLAERSPAAGRIVFLGGVGDEVVNDLYAQCTAFVLPSTQEGLGIVFLEAMSRGKPAIGADAGGIPEVITDGVTGLLAKPRDVASTADAMKRLAADSALAQEMGRRARREISEKFSFSAFEENFRGVLEDLLGADYQVRPERNRVH